MSDFGYDPELPAGFQDADFEMRELEEAGRRWNERRKRNAKRRRNARLLAGLTYAEAEARHAAGTLNDAGWLCFRVCWTMHPAPLPLSMANDVRRLVHDACAAAEPRCDDPGAHRPGCACNGGEPRL
jgi:hypothetical protein